jgi:hypothetical protein
MNQNPIQHINNTHNTSGDIYIFWIKITHVDTPLVLLNGIGV